MNAVTAQTPDAYRCTRRLLQDLRSEPRDVALSREVVQTIRDATADDRVAFSNFDLAIDLLSSAVAATSDDVLEVVGRKAPRELVGRAVWREKALEFIAARLAEVDQAKLASTTDNLLASEYDAHIAFAIGLAGTQTSDATATSRWQDRIRSLALHPTYQVGWAALCTMEQFRDADGVAGVIESLFLTLRPSESAHHDSLGRLARSLDIADELGVAVRTEVVERCEASLLEHLRSEDQSIRRRGYTIALQTCPLRFTSACDLLVNAAITEAERHAQDHVQAVVSRWRDGILTPPRVGQLIAGVTSLVEHAARELGALAEGDLFWSWQFRNACELVGGFPSLFGALRVARFAELLRSVRHTEMRPIVTQFDELATKLAREEFAEG